MFGCKVMNNYIKCKFNVPKKQEGTAIGISHALPSCVLMKCPKGSHHASICTSLTISNVGALLYFKTSSFQS